jgi:hypothetical protein
MTTGGLVRSQAAIAALVVCAVRQGCQVGAIAGTPADQGFVSCRTGKAFRMPGIGIRIRIGLAALPSERTQTSPLFLTAAPTASVAEAEGV